MGSDNLFWKNKKKPSERKLGEKGETLTTFLIVCEGEKTEPKYFNDLKIDMRLSAIHIKIEGCGMNSLTLVKEAIKIKEKEKKKYNREYDKVWCVFDQDNNSKQNIFDAFKLADRNDIKIAYSNECFEIWYLLHYGYFNSGISRFLYEDKLSQCIGFKYDKRIEGMYRILKSKQEIAIRNAKKLLETHPPNIRITPNPSTKVHELIIELKEATARKK